MGEALTWLLTTYGLPGLVIAALGYAYWRSIKRNRELEDRQLKQENIRHEALVGLIKDYAENAKSQTVVTTKLTECLRSFKDDIKESLARLERAKELYDFRDEIRKPTPPEA